MKCLEPKCKKQALRFEGDTFEPYCRDCSKIYDGKWVFCRSNACCWDWANPEAVGYRDITGACEKHGGEDYVHPAPKTVTEKDLLDMLRQLVSVYDDGSQKQLYHAMDRALKMVTTYDDENPQEKK